MIRQAFTIFCLLASSAGAQQINVRSGAHENFARLVLDATPDTEWVLQQNLAGVRLTLEGHQSGFDTSSVFERIDKSFISSVSSDSSSVSVEFSCDCSAQVFAADNGMIVIDVSASPEVQFEFSNTNILQFVGKSSLGFKNNKSEARIQEIRENEGIQRGAPELSSIADSNRRLQLFPLEPEQSQVNLERLNAARSKITQQISAAATRGILDPFYEKTNESTESLTPPGNISDFENPIETSSTIPSNNNITANIRVSTSDSLSSSTSNSFLEPLEERVSCNENQRFDIRTWGGNGSLSQQISRLRAQLYGEFDELNKEIVLKLARTYLYFGFGAEARQTIFLDNDLRRENPEILTIAEILEYGSSPNSEYLVALAECEGEAAFWSILATPSIDATKSVNVNAALRSASALPIHLRSILVPELSRRLLAYGDKSSASTALRSLERAPQAFTSNANLAKADLELAEKSTLQAHERLAQIITSNNEQSAKALIKFVDSHLSEDSEIDGNVASLVEAYAHEMRDNPLEAELRRTHVLALGKSGQFSAAFDALQRGRIRMKQLGEDSLRSTVVELLVNNADDIDFLENAFDQIKIEPERLTIESRINLAKRLLGLGFVEQAHFIIESSIEQSNEDTVALLKAEIALALGRPQEVSTHLFGVLSEEAALLRARAQEVAGDFSKAHQIYSELGREEQMKKVAWLSEDWYDRLENETPVFGPMVSFAQNSLEDQDVREGMLDRTENIISETQNVREAIENLLSSDDLQIR